MAFLIDGVIEEHYFNLVVWLNINILFNSFQRFYGEQCLKRLKRPSFFMKIRKAPLLFFICISFTTLSCDNGESDSSINNLSEFAKEFVSTHMGSSNSINMEEEAPFNQLIENVLNVLMLIILGRLINKMMEISLMLRVYKQSIMLRLH